VTKIENYRKQQRIDSWIIEDLAKSGLNSDNFLIEPLTSETELKERLGFTSIQDKAENWVKIIEIGGYWIPYPNSPSYYRLKLKQPIEGKDGSIKYLSPKKEKGFGNHAYVPPKVEKVLIEYSPDKPIFFTEGEKKATKATSEGFYCVGLSGVWCFKDAENDFLPELNSLNLMYRKVFIVFDSDIYKKHNIEHAELRLAVELMNRSAEVYSVRLPSGKQGEKQGLDDYLVSNGKKALRELVENAQSTLEKLIEEKLPIEIILKELVRLEPIITREELIKKIASSRGVSIAVVKEQFTKLSFDKDKCSNVDHETYTDDEILKTQDLLKSEHILEYMIRLTEQGGYVGEYTNKQMLYLAFTSRLMDNSISCIVKGGSASGKSSLVKFMLRLFPPADVLKFSFISAKALVHYKGSLAHKILFLQEQQGSEAANYSIRTTLSEGEISISSPVKDEATGEFVTQGKSVDARGLVYVETTTLDWVHAENQTRLFDLYMDESQTQTEKILLSQAKNYNQEGFEAELRIWRALQTLLKPHKVLIPFAESLIEPFPKEKLRARRDFKRFLALIKAHALLHQYQREIDDKGRVIARLDDLKAIMPIAGKVLVESLEEISPKKIKVLEIIKTEFNDMEFSLSQLKEKVHSISSKTLSRYLKEFNDEWVIWNGEKGKKSRYALLNSGVPVSQMGSFESRILKSLEIIEDKDECPQLTSMSSINSIKDTRDNKGQNGMSTKDTNNEDELGIKPTIKDMETKTYEDFDVDSWEVELEEPSFYQHSDACDCEVCIPEEQK